MPVNPKSIENLKPIQKGEVRNPKGYPAGVPNRATVLRKLIDTKTKVKGLDGKEAEGTYEDAVNISLLKQAIHEQNVNAIKEILDTLYGKNTDRVQLSSDPDAPVIFQIDGRFKDATENS